jgi:hypothetical protein
MTDLELLLTIKNYIEEMEELADGEWGHCRSADELISAGKMPFPLYSEIVRRLDALTPTSEND